MNNTPIPLPFPPTTMSFLSMLTLLLTHPIEFRTLLQFWIYHEQKRDISAKQEHPTSGWDRESMRKCWEFLDLTSRSFSAVIKELEGDLARSVSGFFRWGGGLGAIGNSFKYCGRIGVGYLLVLYRVLSLSFNGEHTCQREINTHSIFYSIFKTFY